MNETTHQKVAKAREDAAEKIEKLLAESLARDAAVRILYGPHLYDPEPTEKLRNIWENHDAQERKIWESVAKSNGITEAQIDKVINEEWENAAAAYEATQ